MTRQRGYTLLELLIAMAVFAVIAAAAYAGLNQTLRARADIDAGHRRLAQLQRTLTVLERDLLQLTAREVRDAYGDTQPALVAASGGEALLELTRAGWDNPLQQTRSTLQRVGYLLRDDTLQRRWWPVLDRASLSSSREAAILPQVRALRFEWLDASDQWHDHWPPATATPPAAGAPPALPRAVRLRLELADWGEIERLLPLAGTP